VCPSVRTSTKGFADFDLIWCVGRRRPGMRTSVTSTRSKVKVKVRKLPKLRKLHILGISPPPFWHGAQNSWLVVIAWDRSYSLLEPDFEFPSRKVITRVQTSPNDDFSRNSNGHIFVVRDATVTWLGVLVVLHELCILASP